MRQVYFVTTAGVVARSGRSPRYFGEAGLTPIILLSGNGTNLFQKDFPWEQEIGEVRSRIEGPLWVGLWSNNVAYNNFKGTTLFPETDDAGWSLLCANALRLRQVCERYQVAGVCWDGEIYTETPNNNGGPMRRTAWQLTARRGKQLREALGGLPQAQYVMVDDADKLPGWKAYWGGFYRSGDLLLDESGYLKGTERKLAFQGKGVKNLPGRDVVKGVPARNLPRGDFWLYPWTEADALADLRPYAQRWS